MSGFGNWVCSVCTTTPRAANGNEEVTTSRVSRSYKALRRKPTSTRKQAFASPAPVAVEFIFGQVYVKLYFYFPLFAAAVGHLFPPDQ